MTAQANAKSSSDLSINKLSVRAVLGNAKLPGISQSRTGEGSVFIIRKFSDYHYHGPRKTEEKEPVVGTQSHAQAQRTNQNGQQKPFPQLADGLVCLFLGCAEDPVDPAFEVGRSAF
jgi:hypothetical protein